MKDQGGPASAHPLNEAHALRREFMGWQCRSRQIAMRRHSGRPDSAAMPYVVFRSPGVTGSRIVTVLCRDELHSQTAELRHMCRRTHDPAERRVSAVEFMSAGYYQRPMHFSDTLVASFASGSALLESLMNEGRCRLEFRHPAVSYHLECRVRSLVEGEHLHTASWYHNFLFNPELPPDICFAGFEPVWQDSSARRGS